jgi:signal transduction histidine kinase
MLRGAPPAVAAAACSTAGPAVAADNAAPATIELYLTAFSLLNSHELASMALSLGVLFFAVVTSILLLRARRQGAAVEGALRGQISALAAEADRANTLLLSEPQVVVAWAAASDSPELIGDTSIITSSSVPHRVLAFGSWLPPEDAQALERAVGALRGRGQSFAMTVTTLGGKPVEAQGRAIGGRAVMRLRDIGGIRSELADLSARHQQLLDHIGALRTLIDALPSPVWARDACGRLSFVNTAYARAVEAADATDAIERGLELLDRDEREEATRLRAGGETYRGRAPAVVAGTRRIFDVLEVPARSGSAGVALDASEVEQTRAELGRVTEAHRRTLDQLATGVAIFGADQSLRFYNAAYRSLWSLDGGFLDQAPSDSAVLDKLRAARKLPEQQDFRSWKAHLHEAYRALEAREDMWHLPGGRTLRVVTTPNPEGGVTYLFDDVTERLDLERRYDALIRVQGETLDNLAEAVAVFASDGRLRLYNPAFAQMWKLAPEALEERPHIEAVVAWCTPLHAEDTTLRALRNAITSIGQREPVTGRLERRDGSVIDCATLSLPDGATLVTFQDVTDTVNVERALRERNEALEAADRIKVDFLHHVSYELRSPLTNIIGFAHFLGDPATGPLTERQEEYLGYITVSTNALLAIINDILDLATIDAGAMQLNLGPVDIRSIMDEAAEGIRDRLVNNGIRLDIRAAGDIGSFTADERRVRQILYNLLSNAIGFSKAGDIVQLTAERKAGAVVFAVTDQGPGIPADKKDRIFKSFVSDSLGSRHRGAGLGLSIVRSFVELHGGTVEIDSAVGHGTTVLCSFPLDRAHRHIAAA